MNVSDLNPSYRLIPDGPLLEAVLGHDELKARAEQCDDEHERGELSDGRRRAPRQAAAPAVKHIHRGLLSLSPCDPFTRIGERTGRRAASNG